MKRKLYPIAALFVLAVSFVAAGAIRARAADSGLPASGQKRCWNSVGVRVGCGGSGQDGDTRAGAPISLRDNGDGTIVDRNTGLVWEKHSRDGGIHDRANLYTWDQARTVKIAQLNTPPCFAGHCNWRLPNVREMQSVVDFDRKRPALAKAFSKKCAAGCDVLGCSCVTATGAASLAGVWTSTTNVSVPAEAWQIVHNTGDSTSVAKTATGAVRAVNTPVCGQAVVEISVDFAPNPGDPIAGVTALLDYPEAKAGIPGLGNSVQGISNLTGIGSGLFSFGDDDDAVSVGLVSLGQAIPPGPFAGVVLDCGAGEPVPFLEDFSCTPTVSTLLGFEVSATCSLSVEYVAP